VTRSKDRATWLHCLPRFEVPGIDCVETEGIDQLKHLFNRRAVIAGGRHAKATRRAVRTPALLELEIAEVIEALHHPRGGEPFLDEQLTPATGAVTTLWCRTSRICLAGSRGE